MQRSEVAYVGYQPHQRAHNFLHTGRTLGQLPKFLNEMHPADIAEIINHAPIGDQNTLFDLIDQDMKPDVLAELDHQAEADVLEELTDEEISTLVEEMAPMIQPTFSVTSKTINVKKFSSSWKTKIPKKYANFSNTMKRRRWNHDQRLRRSQCRYDRRPSHRTHWLPRTRRTRLLRLCRIHHRSSSSYIQLWELLKTTHLEQPFHPCRQRHHLRTNRHRPRRGCTYRI